MWKPSSANGRRAPRYKIGVQKCSAAPPMVSGARASKTCERCEVTMPRSASHGQFKRGPPTSGNSNTGIRLSPTAMRIDFSGSGCTSINAQFTQSLPMSASSIWFLLGNSRCPAMSSHKRETRKISRSSSDGTRRSPTLREPRPIGRKRCLLRMTAVQSVKSLIRGCCPRYCFRSVTLRPGSPWRSISSSHDSSSWSERL
jgi:hypothetical protein